MNKKININPILFLERLPLIINLISIGIVAYFIILIVTTPFYLNRLRNPEIKKEASKTGLNSVLQEANVYLGVMEKHPLFGNVKQTQAPARSACSDFKARYTLSGIVTGGENEVILNEKAGGKTRFVKAGEVLDGVTIEKIKPQSIVLSCSGEQLEAAIEES